MPVQGQWRGRGEGGGCEEGTGGGGGEWGVARVYREEVLDTKVSGVVASPASLRRQFQTLIALGKKLITSSYFLFNPFSAMMSFENVQQKCKIKP